jgi:4a-hydroxytetrahydrobiopterin dehydratase
MRIIITESQLKKIKSMKPKTPWEEVSRKLIKTFYFDEYESVSEFVNKVMSIAQKQDHHPDIVVHYDNVKISITDYEKGDVSEKCHKLANAIDKIK